MKETLCPSCFFRIDAPTNVSPYAPGPGDFCVCARCATLLRVDQEGKPAIATAADTAELPAAVAETIRNVQAGVKHLSASMVRRKVEQGHLPPSFVFPWLKKP